MTASSEFLIAMSKKMPIHPQYILSHLGRYRDDDGNPLICLMLRKFLHDELDLLLQLGLPMYEAITQGYNGGDRQVGFNYAPSRAGQWDYF